MPEDGLNVLVNLIVILRNNHIPISTDQAQADDLIKGYVEWCKQGTIGDKIVYGQAYVFKHSDVQGMYYVPNTKTTQERLVEVLEREAQKGDEWRGS